MIVWINGAFGSGKSSVADELARKIEKSFVYDPEQVGYFLWDNFPDEMKRKENFQHLSIWREFNYKILKHISDNYSGIIIVPMTIYEKQYFDEIIGSLNHDGVDVNCFVLDASKQTIINRLVGRGEDKNCWAAQHIEKCEFAFQSDVFGQKVDTEYISVLEVVDVILGELSNGN